MKVTAYNTDSGFVHGFTSVQNISLPRRGCTYYNIGCRGVQRSGFGISECCLHNILYMLKIITQDIDNSDDPT